MHPDVKPSDSARKPGGLPLLLGWLLAFCVAAHALRANNAGGFVSTVTTSVTTGTETFGGATDHFLDNGILHVIVTANGSVASIKYLKPGSSGTPEANGTEMVSQSGVNFSNHTAIYYYWYPDGNGDAVYLSTTGSTSNMDLGYKRTYNSSVDSVPVDMEIHYVLGKGNTALYSYMVASHPSSYSTYGDMSISFIQVLWPTAHDTQNFLCEDQYLDDSTLYGLNLNGVQQKRNGLQPSFYDNEYWVGVAGAPKEIGQYTTGTFAGSINGKYSFTMDMPKMGTWGMASDVNHLGLWVVMGSHEYQNNGPTACEYAGGIGGITGLEPLIAHYDNTGLTVSSTANWTKVYGPWAFYFNSLTTGTACWQDARNQAVAEQAAWPYSWMTNSNYQPKAQRAIVTGTLVINDALRPGSSAAGAWVGLAAPESPVENAPDNWQFQSDAYQYWVQAGSDGTFTIPNVQTISPYGGAATYELYAYSSGTSTTTGSVGEFSAGPIAIASGSTTKLGKVAWTVPHLGNSLVWEIGIPDRTAAEFKHGNEYGKPMLWLQFINEFTNPLEYNVSDNNWATALNYCHSVDNMATSPWLWHINFNLTSVIQGTYYLNIAYASPSSVQIINVNDDSTPFATFTPDNADPGATTYIRQGIHSKYSVAHVAIPWSQLQAGANTITLNHQVHSDHADAHFMYDYINLEAPAPVVLPPGRNLIWKGGRLLECLEHRGGELAGQRQRKRDGQLRGRRSADIRRHGFHQPVHQSFGNADSGPDDVCQRDEELHPERPGHAAGAYDPHQERDRHADDFPFDRDGDRHDGLRQFRSGRHHDGARGRDGGDGRGDAGLGERRGDPQRQFADAGAERDELRDELTHVRRAIQLQRGNQPERGLGGVHQLRGEYERAGHGTDQPGRCLAANVRQRRGLQLDLLESERSQRLGRDAERGFPRRFLWRGERRRDAEPLSALGSDDVLGQLGEFSGASQCHSCERRQRISHGE